MRRTRARVTEIAAFAATPTAAFAADTTKVYSSGILVLAFVGFFALVILAQLAPAIMMLIGLIREVAGSLRRRATAELKEKH